MEDVFQQRYLDHQSRKKETLESADVTIEPVHELEYSQEEYRALIKILKTRRSQRIFNDIPLLDSEISDILMAIQVSPSSCNRQAVYVKIAEDKDYIANTLVGGRGWINKADKVLLIFASRDAYKSPNEQGFMPYLDAGVVTQSIYLMSEVLEIGCCFVNPNIREENKQAFIDTYGDDYFCGAVALGNYNQKAKQPPIRSVDKVLVLCK